MKDGLSKKSRLGEFESVALHKSAVLSCKENYSSKLKNLGCSLFLGPLGSQFFGKALCEIVASISLISCPIGSQFFGKALYDLGSSIGLISLSVY